MGVCMFSHGLQCVVEGSRQMPEIDLTWSRINSGGTDVLKTNDRIDELTNGTWQKLMPWKQINETLKPDGLFYIQFTKTARPVILQYESDGTSKETSEFLSVLTKFMQGVEVQREVDSVHERNPSYQVRSNLNQVTVDSSRRDGMGLVAWMSKFVKSCIYCIVTIAWNEIWPKMGKLQLQEYGTRTKPTVYDHMFFIGAFDITTDRQQTLTLLNKDTEDKKTLPMGPRYVERTGNQMFSSRPEPFEDYTAAKKQVQSMNFLFSTLDQREKYMFEISNLSTYAKKRRNFPNSDPRENNPGGAKQNLGDQFPFPLLYTGVNHENLNNSHALAPEIRDDWRPEISHTNNTSAWEAAVNVMKNFMHKGVNQNQQTRLELQCVSIERFNEPEMKKSDTIDKTGTRIALFVQKPRGIMYTRDILKNLQDEASNHTYCKHTHHQNINYNTLKFNYTRSDIFDDKDNPKEWKSEETWKDANRVILCLNVRTEMLWLLFAYFKVEIADLKLDVARSFDENKKFKQTGIKWKPDQPGQWGATLETGSNKNAASFNRLKMQLRNRGEKYRVRQSFEPYVDGSSKSLRARAMISLASTLPQLQNDVEKYLRQYNIPNAELFVRMLRVPNILALRELARQIPEGTMMQKHEKYLDMMPLGTQTELMFLFRQLRNENDFYVTQDDIAEASMQSPQIMDLYASVAALCEIFAPTLTVSERVEIFQTVHAANVDPSAESFTDMIEQLVSV